MKDTIGPLTNIWRFFCAIIMAGISIPGLTVNSNAGGLQPGSSISFGTYGGGMGSPLPITSTGGNVLGASTKASTSGGGSSAPQPNTSTSQTSQQSASQIPNLGSQIDQAYSGEMNFLNGLPGQLQSAQSQAQGAANQQYTGQQQSITDQLSQLNQQLGLDTTNFNSGMNNAYSTAQNQYNQLLQRNLAMYGGGSSAGPAIAGLLGQGYQQQTGQLQGQNTQGQQQLALQGSNINQWGHTQNNQLDTWHNQALQTISNQYNDAINQINQQKGQTEDAKSQAKLGVLQQYIQQQSNLSNYRSQLQSYIQAYQNVSPGQGGIGLTNFDPGNYAAAMSQLGQNVGATQSELPQQYAVNQQAAAPGNAGFMPNFALGGLNNQNQNQLPSTTATFG